MSTQARGRADYWKPGDWNALCYQCGRKRKAGDLMRYWQGYWLCPEHWESRQPQDFVRGVPDIQAAPWVQPPGIDGIPQLFVDIGDSEDTYTLTVSTATIAAVNDTLVIITIMEGVYIGILDLSGLPAGWTVQLNNFGGVGAIIGTATVRAGPPGKPLPDSTTIELAPNITMADRDLNPIGLIGFSSVQTLFELAGSPVTAGNYQFLISENTIAAQPTSLSIFGGAILVYTPLTSATLVFGAGWPTGSVLTLINESATLLGGFGNLGFVEIDGTTLIPTAGTPAIDLSGQQVYLINRGTIAGGGGGVGAGGSIGWHDPVNPIGISAVGDYRYSAGACAIIALNSGIYDELAADVASSWEQGCAANGLSSLPRGSGFSGTGGDLGEAGTAGENIGSRPTVLSSFPGTAGAAAGRAIKLSGGTLIIVQEGTIIGDVS